jgi:quercetin dioxygenase-like cupin family protein
MSYEKVNYADVEPVSDAMHFLREPLKSSSVGVTIVRCDPGWRSQKHDHAGDEQEEIYVLMRGEATVRIDGEDVPMESGDVLRIPPESTRQIRNSDQESAFVLVSGPEFDEESEEGSWSLTGFAG